MSEIYLEMQRNGAYLKCTAVCAETGEEAMAMGPVKDPEGVKRLAVLKLEKQAGLAKAAPAARTSGIDAAI